MAKRNAGKVKQQNNELTLAALKDINKKFKEKIEIEIDGYTVKIDKHWSQKKVDDLLEETMANFTEHMDRFTGSFGSQYALFMMIKYFTSLKIPKEFKQQIQWLEQLVEPGYYKEIVSHFPQDEMTRILDQVTTSINNLNQNWSQIIAEAERIMKENNVEGIETNDVDTLEEAESEDSE